MFKTTTNLTAAQVGKWEGEQVGNRTRLRGPRPLSHFLTFPLSFLAFMLLGRIDSMSRRHFVTERLLFAPFERQEKFDFVGIHLFIIASRGQRPVAGEIPSNVQLHVDVLRDRKSVV